MPAPNPEQLKAIKHSGGVLLSAGAGSGKTFVLKEHMLYLAQQWQEVFNPQEHGDFRQYIRREMRKVVLMTFTKKAAGELELRIRQSFEERAQREASEHWNIVLESLDLLSISTIHGFCFKLINQGFFPSIPMGQEVLDESEFDIQISRCFEAWLEQNQSQLKGTLRDLFFKNSQAIIQSLKKVMGDPSLRLAWAQASEEELSIERINAIVGFLYQVRGLENIFSSQDYHEEEFVEKPWYKALIEFEGKVSDFASGVEGFCRAYDYFKPKNFRIPNTPRGKTIPEYLLGRYREFKQFKDTIKEYGEDFKAFMEHRETYVIPWFSMIRSMILDVEEKYRKLEGLTFSDLEFYVLQGLKQSHSLALIRDQYQYFIIDEFQDTSFVQFDILLELAGEDYSKLFCVGDVKQAIYGFRGGELNVFEKCTKNIPKLLSLKNNYRSLEAVTSFNNLFFEKLFDLGLKFEGRDLYRVPFEHQTSPSGKEGGVVERVKVTVPLPGEEKYSNFYTDFVEAHAIAQYLADHKEEKTVILYRRLKPSQYLINQLISRNMGFTAQVKVPYTQEPIIGLLYLLLEYELNKELDTRFQYLKLVIDSYLKLLGGQNVVPSEKDIDDYLRDKKFFGQEQAFRLFVNRLQLTHSNYNASFGYLSKIIKRNHDTETLFLKLKEDASSKISVDFKYGINSDQINIMTAHASKGLEFPTVILGGIYTNDSPMPNASFIGKIPSSFKWTDSIHGKGKFKTPQMIFEEIIEKQKDFSESKRLFYVANTRAEEKLVWIDIDFTQHKRDRAPAGCWFNGIQKVLAENKLALQESELVMDLVIGERTSLEQKLAPPMFHIDPLAVGFKDHSNEEVLMSEMSITKLAVLAQCPRRFYLANICKITEQELTLLEDIAVVDYEIDVSDEITSANIKASSAERGTAIHETISLLLQEKCSPDLLEKFSTRDRENMSWVVEKLKAVEENYEFISEKQIKFEILHYMFSGIPDLIALPNNDSLQAEVWDFKTGKLSESKLNPYFMQLYCYAMSQYYLGAVNKENPIRLVLCFLDERKIVDKTVSFNDVENYLFKSLGSIGTPDVKNESECTYCPYKTVCL